MDDQSEEIAILQEKLRESELRYNSLMDNATDGICMFDLDDHIFDVNSGLCKMLGYTREELLKLNVHHMIDPEQLKVDPLFKSGIETKKNLVRERRFMRKDGSMLEVELNGKLFDKNRVVFIARDITSRKMMERELREAELKFRTIAERSMVGIYIVQHGMFSYVNPRFASIFGYTPAEMINTHPIEQVFHEDYKSIATENVRARIAGEVESVNYEAKCNRKDGSTNWVEFYGSGTIFEEERSIIGSMIDITERKRAEEIRLRSEANLQTILNTTDTAYALFDKELRVLALNQMAVTFFQDQYNYTPEIGKKIRDYFPEDKFPQLTEQTVQVLQGNNINYEINYPKPDGFVLWFYVRLFPIKNEQGEIFGLMLALYDITEQKAAEGRLKEAYFQIQNQVNHIKDMTWKQSHLIRSPLANLKGLVNLLVNDPVDIESLQYLHHELRRLDDIIIEMAEKGIDA